MRAAVRFVVCLALVALAGNPAIAGAQDNRSRVTGHITDDSAGALPGVTVIIAWPRGTVATTAVTDATGQFRSVGLPPGAYTVSFELSGFETSTIPVILRPGEAFVLDRKMGVAPLSETVNVVAPAPKPPRPVPVERPRLRPVQPVSKATLESVCGPSEAVSSGMAYGRVAASRDDEVRRLDGNNDALVLDVGSDGGVSYGQNLVVRRRFRVGGAEDRQLSVGEQTAGLIQVVETAPASSIAVVIYACGELVAGDAVAPVELLPTVTTQLTGKPQFDDPARIVFGDNGQSIGGPQQLMVIDRGMLRGVRRGQRLAIFRRPAASGGRVATIGDGVIVAVLADSATIRIESARDAIAVGDLVALYR